MGVFKWLRRERVTVSTHHSVAPDVHQPQSAEITGGQAGTIRTDEYKRDLAEFQARRSSGVKTSDLHTPKKKCGRHSLPISCTDCGEHDNTFNYEKKSANKYKKKKRAHSNTPEKLYEGVPNIQFLFQNQVFMPGNVFSSTYTEPLVYKRDTKRTVRSPDFLVQKEIDFKENEAQSPPEFFKNNSLPFNLKTFMDGSKEEVDGLDLKSSHSNIDGADDNNVNGDEKLWEVMSELKNLDKWADEQLTKSPNACKSDDSKSDCSAYGLPIASARSLDISADRKKVWNNGRWGVVPVQMKKLAGVSVDHVRKKRNTEINILRKCRHPNIILLMGLYPDINNNVHIICERCVDSLFGVLHVQGRILTVQTAVQYTLDIANAMLFLQMQGYIHTELSSMSIMITSHDTAKLADLGPCVKVRKVDNCLKDADKSYELYSPEPQYVNIEDARESKTSDNEPLLSSNPSEVYLKENAVAKPFENFQNSELYRWQAPELFTPAEDGMVHPCSKSDVYSLSLILWEGCNASIPWKQLSYEALRHQYSVWRAGVPLPQDGTYPGCLLALLQAALSLDRATRLDLSTLQKTLQTVKSELDKLGYIIIPARLAPKKSKFSSVGWDTTSPTDSDCRSANNLQHSAVVHNTNTPESSTDGSEKENCHENVYESIRKSYTNTSYTFAKKCFIDDDDNVESCSLSKYKLLPEKEFSSACSTPIAKFKTRKDIINTPGALHRSDSTEYCSILSPNRTNNFTLNDDSNRDQSGVERPTAKLSRSFTPKSYKPLHIKVPECNLESIKPLLKDKNEKEKSSYNFDIKNYSLPSTPIARSNKLRKNAWLSGDVESKDFEKDENEVHGASLPKTPSNEDCSANRAAIRSPASSETNPKSSSCTPELCASSENNTVSRRESLDTVRSADPARSIVSQDVSECAGARRRVEDELAGVTVKPLVAIHERWILEANRKPGRSLSLPEEHSFRSQIAAVKPASHCVDTLQHSLPQLNSKKPANSQPSTNNHGGQWAQFCRARDNIARGLSFSAGSPERRHGQTTNFDIGVATEDIIEPKIDQCTDTSGIEDFIRDLIRKEFQHLLHDLSDDTSPTFSRKNEEMLNKGVSNIMESLHNNDSEKNVKKDPVTSFSRIKINGNNKPLLQITFNRSGENSIQVLDNCVNVSICDNAGKEKMNVSLEDTLTEDPHAGGLKRCQAFNAIQEARSTEDLYIDDELCAHTQDNFGRVKLIPLHGSLHEILCEREDDCCLIKVKQEHGCDTVYFRCDNSDTESRDAVDGGDTVVYKRSISLVEERIRLPTHRPDKPRPKSEIFAPIQRESRVLSNSSPALNQNSDEPELNIENVMCYQDSSSDECLKCHSDNDDFEFLENKIEQDIKSAHCRSSLPTVGCCLAKISEENLAGNEHVD